MRACVPIQVARGRATDVDDAADRIGLEELGDLRAGRGLLARVRAVRVDTQSVRRIRDGRGRRALDDAVLRPKRTDIPDLEQRAREREALDSRDAEERHLS